MQDNLDKQIQEPSEDEFDVYAPSPIQNQIGTKQKVAVIVLSVFAVFVMVLWAVRFQDSITGPLQPKAEQVASNNSLTPEDAQRTSDTDKDGLTDWDELNLYKTSPYLEDTDSDKLNDKQEIDAGKNPNCPEGRTCTSLPSTASSATSSSTPDIYSSGTTAPSTQTTTNTADSSDLKQLFSENMDVATLRELLISQGMKKADLDKIGDEKLMQSFKEVLGTQNKSTVSNSTSNSKK
jgi:hypothetical protein